MRENPTMKKIVVGVFLMTVVYIISGCGKSDVIKQSEQVSSEMSVSSNTPTNSSSKSSSKSSENSVSKNSSLSGLEKVISESDYPGLFYYFWYDIKKVCDDIEDIAKQTEGDSDCKFDLFDKTNIPQIYSEIDTSKISESSIFNDYKKYEVTVEDGKVSVVVDDVLFYPVEGGRKTVQDLTEKYK